MQFKPHHPTHFVHMEGYSPSRCTVTMCACLIIIDFSSGTDCSESGINIATSSMESKHARISSLGAHKIERPRCCGLGRTSKACRHLEAKRLHPQIQDPMAASCTACGSLKKPTAGTACGDMSAFCKSTDSKSSQEAMLSQPHQGMQCMHGMQKHNLGQS
jgi:hypothetical protein